jgi:MFS family permease
VAKRSEIADVYLAGVVQGLALVTFPAAGHIFTSADYFGLSSTAYGAMFLPQAGTAIAASLLGAGLTRRLGIKRIFTLGLAANLLAMALLVASQLLMAERGAAYAVLLAATASLGVGFGLTVPALNTYAAAFFPQRVDAAVLAMNALLGLGTALAPVFVALFVGLGIWWGLPLLAAALLAALLVFSLRLPLKGEGLAQGAAARTALPPRFWVYAAFALVYGICETLNGNWASLYMARHVGASTTTASLALTAFWGMVTVGRVLFAAVERWWPDGRTYRALPFVVAGAFLATAALPRGSPALGVLAFGLAGFGCSALLPLTISFAQKELTTMAAAVAGALIACYQIGYGLAAFGVGPLEGALGLSLDLIYRIAAVVAAVLAGLAFAVARRGANTARITKERTA